jgi:hypothetical protein
MIARLLPGRRQRLGPRSAVPPKSPLEEHSIFLHIVRIQECSMTTSSCRKQPTGKQPGRERKHERMILTGRDRDMFLRMVANPPAPTQKLVATLKLHRRLFG